MGGRHLNQTSVLYHFMRVNPSRQPRNCNTVTLPDCNRTDASVRFARKMQRARAKLAQFPERQRYKRQHSPENQ
jgi:hypothetical protein